MPFDQFTQAVTKNQGGLIQQRRLKAIWDAAADSIGCRVDRASDFESQVLVEKVGQVQKEIKETQRWIEIISRDFTEYHLLQTIPGVGPYVASVVVSVIGDPWRFDSAKQVLKMAGYDLSAKRSGKGSETAVPVISKKGNAALRYGLYQAAFVASAKNIHFVEYYTNLLRGRERERGIKTKMRVKIAAKMLVIAWTLMKKGQEFNPDFLKPKE
jgi:transposase